MKIRNLMTLGLMVAGFATMAQAQSYYGGGYNAPGRYAAGREQVSHVWVNGKMLLNDRQLTTLDEQELLQRAGFWQEQIGMKG